MLRVRSFNTAARSLRAREKSTDRTLMRPSVLRWSTDSVELEEKPERPARGVRAVMVGLTAKLIHEPGVICGIERILRPVSSCRDVTALYRFSPVVGDTPSNCAFWPEIKKARTACETFCTTCA